MSGHEHAVNVEDLDWSETDRANDFEFRQKGLAAAAGGTDLGCSLYEIPPGKRSFPYHYHMAKEEAMFVLSGEGTLRLAGEDVPVVAGDYVALPTGEDGAHQVRNTGDDVLRYLCVSVEESPDVLVYPDSGKVRANTDEFDTILDESATMDYWEGEG